MDRNVPRLWTLSSGSAEIGNQGAVPAHRFQNSCRCLLALWKERRSRGWKRSHREKLELLMKPPTFVDTLSGLGYSGWCELGELSREIPKVLEREPLFQSMPAGMKFQHL